MLTVHLPHPAKALRPNTMRRCHWAPIANARAAARDAARTATWDAINTTPDTDISAINPPRSYSLIWYYKGKRPDADNCLASIKAYLDGCCDTLGIDDNILDVYFILRVHDKQKANTLDINFYTIYPTHPDVQ